MSITCGPSAGALKVKLSVAPSSRLMSSVSFMARDCSASTTGRDALRQLRRLSRAHRAPRHPPSNLTHCCRTTSGRNCCLRCTSRNHAASLPSGSRNASSR